MKRLPTDILAANIKELWRHPGGEELVSRSGRQVPIVHSRTGLPVPAPHGRPRHSRYDPIREGQQMARACPPGGFLLALGFGAGYHLKAFLASSDTTRLLIVEHDPDCVTAALSLVDLSDVLGDPRVSYLGTASRELVAATIRSNYNPLLDGAFLIVPLRSAQMETPQYYQEVATAARAAVATSSEDLTTQRRLARRWTRNLLANLEVLKSPPLELPRVGRCVVVAAGPSADGIHRKLAASLSDATVVACDTALPMLRDTGVEPDIVVSLDAHHTSYHHFMGGMSSRTSLVAELGCDPRLLRQRATEVFRSGHPLAQDISNELTEVSQLDHGGSVTHAAVSLCRRLGADQLEIVGANFSYPRGSPYARGTYLFHHFSKTDTRVSPTFSRLLEFALDRPGATGSLQSKIQTPLLGSYQDALTAITAAPVSAWQPRMPVGAQHVRAYLSGLHERVVELPAMTEPLRPYYDSLSDPKQRSAFATLVPLATAWDTGRPRVAMEQARGYLVGRIREQMRRAE